MTSKNPVRALLIDVDGTLVDSNDQHAQAWYEAFQVLGYTTNYDVVRGLIGMGGDKLIPRCIGQREDSEAGKKLAELRTELFLTKHLAHVKPLPKARKLIERLMDEGLKLVIASSAAKAELEPLLEIADVQTLVRNQVSADDVGASKPSPDVIHRALEKIDTPPRQVRLLGDTPYDVEAAALADVRTIAFRSGGFQDNQLTGAVRVFEGPADLLKCIEKEGLAAALP